MLISSDFASVLRNDKNEKEQRNEKYKKE
jgi:hypothetical protein